MTHFRHIINGPPCRIKKEESSFFLKAKEGNLTGVRGESRLVDWMCRFSEAQKESHTFEALQLNWIRHFHDMGILMFGYYHVQLPAENVKSQYALMTDFCFPKAWQKASKSKGMCEDNLLVSYAFTKNEAFKFSDLSHCKSETESEEIDMQLLRHHNISEGYCIPIFGSDNCHGFYLLGLGENHIELNKRQVSMIQWACQIGHSQYVDLMVKRKIQEQVTMPSSAVGSVQQESTRFSDREAADQVIAELSQANIEERAVNKNQSYLFQISAAMQFGYGEPYSLPQRDLNYKLVKMTASKQVTQDAWKLYHMLRQMPDN